MNTAFKKAVAVLMAMVMLVSVMSTAAFATGTEIPEISHTLVLDEEYVVSITEGGSSQYLAFTPQEDGEYVLAAESRNDSFAYLYDSQMNELASDDDSAENGGDFRLSYYLTAGETYYYSVLFYDNGTVGDITVVLTKSEETTQGSPDDIVGFTLQPDMLSIDEYTNGEYVDDGEGEYFRYDVEYLFYHIRVQTADGSEYSCSVNNSGYRPQFQFGDTVYMLKFYDDQSYDNQWQGGECYSVTAQISGTELYCEIPVEIYGEIVEPPIEEAYVTGIEVEPVTITALTNGYLTNKYSDEKQDWEFYYYYNLEKIIPAINVLMSDGEVVECPVEMSSGDGIFIEHYLGTGYINIYSEQDTNPWCEGGTYTATVSVLGFETDFEVTIEQPNELFLDEDNEIEYEDEEEQFFAFTPEKTTTYVFESFSEEHDPYICAYAPNLEAIGSDDAGGNDQNFKLKCHLNAGETYYFSVFVRGGEGICNVRVSEYESPIENIEFQPIEIVENNSGWVEECIDEETGEPKNYYVYNWKHLLEYTVNMVDGAQFTDWGTGFWYEGESHNFIFDESTPSYNERWLPGNTYYEEVSLYGKTYEISITIKENPIQEIEFKPITLIEGISSGDLRWDYDWESESSFEYFEYFWYEKLSYIITMKNGEIVESTGPTFYYDGEGYSFSTSDNQYECRGWKIGEPCTATATIFEKQYEVSVTVEENPVEKVEFEPITLNENIDGVWSWYFDENGTEQKYYRYEYENKLLYTITLKDGEEITGKINADGRIELFDEWYYIEIEDSQSADNIWTVGNTYTLPIELLGVESEVSISIVEPQFPEIQMEVEQEIIVSNSGERAYLTFTPEEDGTYIFESTPDSWEICACLYDSEMSSITGSHGGFQMEVELQGGKKYYLGTWYEGYDEEYSYSIKVTKLPDITELQIGDIEIFENTNGYMATDVDGNEYYYYSNWHWQIPSIKIVMSDGNEYNARVDEDNSELCFGVDYGDDYYKWHYPEITVTQDEDNRWTVGNTYTATIALDGVAAQVNISIIETPIESIEIDPIKITEKTGGYYWDGWNDETGDYEEYYIYEWWNKLSGTITFKDGTELTIRGTGFDYQDEWYYLDWQDDQSIKNPWTVGNTYTPTISVFGYSKEVEVSINPMVAQELILGEKTTVDIREEGEIKFFSFTPEEDGTYRFTSISDEDTYGYLYSEEMEELAANDDGDDSNFFIEYELYAGETYYLGAKYYNIRKTGSFDVKVIVAPTVTDIVFEDVEFFENTNGYFTEDTNGNEYYYYGDWQNEISKIIIKTSDGEETECHIDGSNSDLSFRYNGRWYYPEIIVTQDEANRWTAGNTYTANASVLGFDTTFDITIIESPIESIHSEPISIIENAHGSYLPGWDEEDNYSEYFAYAWKTALRYTVTFKNGDVVEDMGYAFEHDGQVYELSYNDSQETLAGAWTVGNTYNAQIGIAGCYADVSVSIIETPVESIEIQPITIEAKTNGDWHTNWETGEEYYYYYWLNNILGVATFKDGTTHEVSDLFEYEGISYDLLNQDNQEREPWLEGNTYYPAVYFLGYETEVEVSILEQNIENGIKYMLQNDCAIVCGIEESEGEVLTIPETLAGYPVTAITSLEGSEHKEIIVPDSVTAISNNWIYCCENVEKITIGAGVSLIKNSMFDYAVSLTQIEVSDENEEYSSYDGIVYDKELTKMVAIPKGRTAEHTVPNTVININAYINGRYNFEIELSGADTGYIKEDGILYNEDKTIVYSCDSNKTGEYVMPESVTTIGDAAFKNSALTEITVSNNVSDIVYYAFAESINLEKVVLPDTLTSISESAFEGCVNLTDITIPSSLETLGPKAFAKSGIKTAHIPSGVLEISYCAFMNSALENLTFDEGIECIEGHAFFDTNIKSVALPDSLLNICDNAFRCSALEEVEFGSGLISIGHSAFAETNLLEVELPESIEYVGEQAFAYTKISKLDIPENGVYIDESAFSGIAIETLDLPESVTDISYKCFENSKNLINIDISDNIESLGGFAFHGTAWYESQPDGVVYLEDSLYHYKGEMEEGCEVVIDNGTKLIADYAFADYDELASVYIPKTVKRIGKLAFANTGLFEVYYYGSEEEAEDIIIEYGNNELLDAEWYYNACDHDWQEATCTEPEICLICGEIGEEAWGHDWLEATCEEPETCDMCGETRGKPLGHNFVDYEYQEDATCTEDGTEIGYCEECGEEDERVAVGTKTGHFFSEYESNEDATCTEDGTKTAYCDECGEEKTVVDKGSKLSHDYDQKDTASKYRKSKATCTTKAVYYYSCECGAKGKKTFTSGKALGHEYESKVTKATFKKNGATYKECERCEKITSKKTIYKIDEVELSVDEYTYNGKYKTPRIIVKDSKGKTISSKYYTISGTKKAKNVGKFKITIEFKTRYSGSKSLYYTINPKKTSVSKVTAAKKSLKVTIKKQSAQVTGYQIQYSTSKSFKSAKTKTVKGTSITLKSLRAKKTYYVRVRTYKTVKGKKYYSDWSSAKSKKTK